MEEPSWEGIEVARITMTKSPLGKLPWLPLTSQTAGKVEEAVAGPLLQVGA
jgi:hypothetical protein